jgi:hypothetical protein
VQWSTIPLTDASTASIEAASSRTIITNEIRGGITYFRRFFVTLQLRALCPDRRQRLQCCFRRVPFRLLFFALFLAMV